MNIFQRFFGKKKPQPAPPRPRASQITEQSDFRRKNDDTPSGMYIPCEPFVSGDGTIPGMLGDSFSDRFPNIHLSVDDSPGTTNENSFGGGDFGGGGSSGSWSDGNSIGDWSSNTGGSYDSSSSDSSSSDNSSFSSGD